MKELPKRKRLRLENYDYSSNGLYFITICTKNKEPILSKIVGDDGSHLPVRSLKTMVTREIGFSIWQRSYNDEIIKNEKHFQRVWNYIDYNALKEYGTKEHNNL